MPEAGAGRSRGQLGEGGWCKRGSLPIRPATTVMASGFWVFRLLFKNDSQHVLPLQRGFPALEKDHLHLLTGSIFFDHFYAKLGPEVKCSSVRWKL